MTNSKLIELLIKYQKREITGEDIFSLKDLTDEEIEIVLNTNHKNETIQLLTNENFKKLPGETKTEIIQLLSNIKEGSMYLTFIVRIATNKNIIEYGNVLEIINIIKKARSPIQIETIIQIASNKNVISSDKVVEICQLFTRREKDKEKLKIAAFAATDIHIIRSGNVLNVVKKIISAPNKEEALSLYYSYMNEYKDLTLLIALRKGNINKIDFWTALLENPEEAISLLVQINDKNEIGPNEIITKEQVGYTRKIKQ